MSRLRIVLASAVLALAATAPAGAAVPKLAGTVGPGFSISLKQGGKAVKTLKRGRVTITVADRSDFHNFHLTGLGVNVKTAVSATGSRTFTVTLRNGTYRFVCDPHAASLRGSFTVR